MTTTKAKQISNLKRLLRGQMVHTNRISKLNPVDCPALVGLTKLCEAGETFLAIEIARLESQP